MRQRQLTASLVRLAAVAWVVLIACWTSTIEARSVQPLLDPAHSSRTRHVSSALLDLRGGASRGKGKTRTGSPLEKTATGKKKVQAAAKAADKPSALVESLQQYKKILPITRLYITMVGIVSVLGLILGEELTQTLLALDPIRITHGLELWRPLTAACFLGPLSIGWLMSSYYLFQYGSSLERAYGSAQQLVFLLSQIGMLSVLSVLTGQPFFAQSMISSMLHVLSRAMPHQKVKWLVFTVPYWSLPYGLMLSDVLQAQGSPAAALPHILGILSGHFYQFHKFVWPRMGGEDWLQAPDWLVQRLNPEARPSESAADKAAKSRNRKKGRKLGG